MSLYNEMQQLTREILSDPDFKQGSTQLVKMTPGTGPVHNPGPSTAATHQIDGAVRGVAFKYVAGGLAVASDLQITFAVVPGVVPEMTDFVVSDGKTFKIVQIIPKPAAGVPVSYTLLIRKGGA